MKLMNYLLLPLLLLSAAACGQTNGHYVRVNTVTEVFFSPDTVLNVVTNDTTFQDTIRVGGAADGNGLYSGSDTIPIGTEAIIEMLAGTAYGKYFYGTDIGGGSYRTGFDFTDGLGGAGIQLWTDVNGSARTPLLRVEQPNGWYTNYGAGITTWSTFNQEFKLDFSTAFFGNVRFGRAGAEYSLKSTRPTGSFSSGYVQVTDNVGATTWQEYAAGSDLTLSDGVLQLSLGSAQIDLEPLIQSVIDTAVDLSSAVYDDQELRDSIAVLRADLDNISATGGGPGNADVDFREVDGTIVATPNSHYSIRSGANPVTVQFDESSMPVGGTIYVSVEAGSANATISTITGSTTFLLKAFGAASQTEVVAPGNTQTYILTWQGVGWLTWSPS